MSDRTFPCSCGKFSSSRVLTGYEHTPQRCGPVTVIRTAAPKPENHHQTTPGRVTMTFTTLTTKD